MLDSPAAVVTYFMVSRTAPFYSVFMRFYVIPYDISIQFMCKKWFHTFTFIFQRSGRNSLHDDSSLLCEICYFTRAVEVGGIITIGLEVN